MLGNEEGGHQTDASGRNENDQDDVWKDAS